MELSGMTDKFYTWAMASLGATEPWKVNSVTGQQNFKFYFTLI